MERIDKYLPLKENNEHFTHLKVSVTYSLGGYNYWYSQNTPRGYYLNVMPVELSESMGHKMESYHLLSNYSGLKFLLKEVKRQSKTREQEAIEIAEQKMDEYANIVLNQCGLELA